MKKSKVLSLLTAGAMCVAMLPMSAFAAGIDAPHVDSATIADTQSVSDANGNLYLTVPTSLQLANKTFELTTSEKVSFVATSETAAGQLYASEGSDTSATLRFAINAPGYDLDSEDYSISLTSSDGIEWTGTFNENFNATMAVLGQGLNYSNATLRAGTVVNDAGTGNAIWDIYTNSDAANTQLVICDPDSQMVTVTYVYGEGENDKYEWNLPEGAPLPQVTIPGNLVLEGWYTDDTYTTKATFGQAVTADMELYANLVAAEDTSSFADALERGDSVLYISDMADWNSFVANSDDVAANQRVELLTDINCGGASYTALNFDGDFNGNNHTISNATFTSNGNYAGMFAELGATQKIANLYLDNITISGSMLNTSNFSGVLAGRVYGVNETPRENCLIQNVHVTNSSVSGYTCGGLVGYSFASMIRYCSVENTSVSGLANAAGIVGLTYGDVDACYSNGMTLFGLQARGRGGIAGKILESGNVTNCWYSYDGDEGPAGEIIDGTEDNNVSTSDSAWSWMSWAANQTVWTVSGQSASFIPEAIEYSFGA